MKTTKKVLSLILALAMFVSILCTSAFAADLDTVTPRYRVGTCPNCGVQGAVHHRTEEDRVITKTVEKCAYYGEPHIHTFVGDVSHWDCPNCGTIMYVSNMHNQKCPYQ